MKKIIVLLICIFMLSAIGVMAQDETGDDNVGNPYGYSVGERNVFQAFTVINNFKCDESISWQKQSVITTSQICWDNRNGGSPGGNGVEHGGVEYQLFTTFNGVVDQSVNKVTMEAGERKCIAVPNPGDVYYRQAFFCDSEQSKCEETFPYYTAGCDLNKCAEGEVLRVRGLKDVTSNGCNEEGWKSEVCIEDNVFGFDCSIPDDSGDAGSGQDGSGGGVSDVTLRGEWQNIGIPTIVKSNEKFIIKARFVAAEEGKYYLEAGMLEQAFSIVAEGSKCDGDLHFAGTFQTLKKDESVDITFNILAQDAEGTRSVVIGAYTGCLDEGGVKLNVLSQGVKVTTTPGEGSDVGTGLILSGATITLIFAFIVLLVILWIIWLIFFKK